MDLLNNVKRLCKEKGMKLGDVADKIGVDPANLTNSLKGNPTLNRLKDLSTILGVTIDELIGEKDDKGSDVAGFVEVNGEVVRITCKDDLRTLSEKAGAYPAICQFLKDNELKKAIRKFIVESMKTNDTRSLWGQFGRREIFCLISMKDNGTESEEAIDNKIFVLTLLQKNSSVKYELLEYGNNGDYDLDSNEGLVRNISNDIEWQFESSKSTFE